MSTAQRGLYFEEFEIGQTFSSEGRTITEADILSFAEQTGDFNKIHVDPAYAAASPFGQQVAHGMLGMSIAIGQIVQTGIMEETIMAFREINNWKFANPVFIGDAIHADLEVTETKAYPRLGGGVVTIAVVVKNQTDEIVMKGSLNVLFHSKPQE